MLEVSTSKSATFWLTGCVALLLVDAVGVLYIFLVRQQFKIFKSIIRSIQILVVYLKSSGNWAIKRFPDYTMYLLFGVFAILAKINNHVLSTIWSRINWSVVCITAPCFAAFDRLNSGYADPEKLGNLLQRRTRNKHTLGFRNFVGSDRLASGHAAHISVIADLVQAFKSKNRLPCFHTSTP